MIFPVILALLVMGAIMGSFACCQAWRIHERGRKKMPKRSCCMQCGHQLKWWENVPVFSWLILKGRCKKCGKRIGAAEILAEIAGALAFVGCYAGVVGFGAEVGEVSLWTWGRLGFVLILLVVLGVLAVYDGKWGELPGGLLVGAIGLAALSLLCREMPIIISGAEMGAELLSIIAAVGLTAGVFLVLSYFSHGKLMGDGDWILGLALGLALGDWWLALILLAVSNLMAVFWAVFRRKRKIYFAPFFVLGFVIVLSLEKVICLQCLI